MTSLNEKNWKFFRFGKHLPAFACAMLFSSLHLMAQPSIQWDKTLGGIQEECYSFLLDAKQTSDGKYILTGESNCPAGGDKSESSAGESSIWVVMLDTDGTKIWDRTMSGGWYETSNSVCEATDGGFFISGSSASNAGRDKSGNSKGGGDFWIIKLDVNGEVQWEKTIGGSGEDTPVTIIPTADNGCLAAGTSSSDAGGDKTEDSRGGRDIWLVKLGADGEKMWDKTYGGSAGETLFDFHETTEGNLILAASSNSPVSGEKSEGASEFADLWVLQVSSNGTKLSDKTIYVGRDVFFTDFALTSDGGFIVVGRSISGPKSEYPTDDNFDGWVAKYKTDGSLDWERAMTGLKLVNPKNDRFGSVIQNAEGSYLISGFSNTSAGLDKIDEPIGDWTMPGAELFGDVWVVKLKADGTTSWDMTLGGEWHDGGGRILQTLDGGYLLVGTSNSEKEYDKTDVRKGMGSAWIVKLEAETSLPVTLARFDAKKENTTALLTWSTASETNSERFEVHHSINGKSWTLLKTIKSQGESSSLFNYRYVHANPTAGETNLYRLKMIDADGTFTTSKIRAVHFDDDISFIVFPNPVAKNLSIQMDNWQQVSTVQLINNNAEQVYQSASGSKLIPVDHLSAGMYYLKINYESGKTSTRKVIIGK